MDFWFEYPENTTVKEGQSYRGKYMQIDLTKFKGSNVKVVATIDQTLYRNVGAIILYEEDSHTLSVRKLKRKIADQYIPTDELGNFLFDS